MRHTNRLPTFLVVLSAARCGLFGCSFAPAQEMIATPTEFQPVSYRTYPAEELEQLVAPIAIHPDELLSQILMAATHPLEIVEAARWVRANPGLAGDAQAIALESMPWDPSVKSMVNFPEVLFMMDERLDWTQRLGEAVLAQEGEMMDAVQRLRARALAAGTLVSTPEQTVIVEEPIVRIVPVAPEVIYVPVYNPAMVYGAWPYPAYPPYACYPPGFVFEVYPYRFLAGVHVDFAWGYAWGRCSWGHREIVVDVDRHARFNHHIDREAYRRRLSAARQVFPLRATRDAARRHDADRHDAVITRDRSTVRSVDRRIDAETRTHVERRGSVEASRPAVRTTPAQPERREVRPAPARQSPPVRAEARPAPVVRQTTARADVRSSPSILAAPVTPATPPRGEVRPARAEARPAPAREPAGKVAPAARTPAAPRSAVAPSAARRTQGADREDRK